VLCLKWTTKVVGKYDKYGPEMMQLEAVSKNVTENIIKSTIQKVPQLSLIDRPTFTRYWKWDRRTLTNRSITGGIKHHGELFLVWPTAAVCEN